MAEILVTQSASNAAPDGALYELARIVNALQAELAALATKLNADAGTSDGDYEGTIGNTDTIKFRESGVPS